MTYLYIRYYSTALLSLLSILSILLLQMQLSDATSKSPYDSGYDHGCDDADVPSPSGRHINQPEKGPSFHTDEFMRAYTSGFNACNDEGNEISTGMIELEKGQHYGTCEETSKGMACDIEND